MIKKLTSLVVIAITAVSLLGVATPVFAATGDDVRTGVGLTGPAPTTSVDGIISTVINVLSIVVGVVAVIMIIIGGLKYITSSGDSANVTSAKNTILYAIIGLVVVAMAQIIVLFVLDKAA